MFQTQSFLVNGKFIVSKPFVHSKFENFIQQNTNISYEITQLLLVDFLSANYNNFQVQIAWLRNKI